MRRRATLSRRLVATFAVGGLAVGALAAVGPSAAAAGQLAQVTSLFPSNALTVTDHRQLTGRRVHLPLRNCSVQVTTCNERRLINRLDGFDLDPRLALRFSAPVDAAQVARQTTVVAVDPHAVPRRTGIDRIVYDASTHTVYAHPTQQLAKATTYVLRVHHGHGISWRATRFTTESATTGLLSMRKQLDNGSAYRAAPVTGLNRRLRVEHVFPETGTTLAYTTDNGTKGGLSTASVPNTSFTRAGSYVFGSYLAPSWLSADSSIAQTPTKGSGPPVTGRTRLPFVLILPAGRAPRGGWPVAIFGHGFTRSDADMFLAADFNASYGFATIATDVAGHGGGPRSTWDITRAGLTTKVPAYARGRDQDSNGTITSTEGVSTPIEPAPDAAIGNRDGLRQTVADQMSLVRAIGRGVSVNGIRLRRTGVDYYGQSFGGIYGVLLAGTDPKVAILAPNVAGGPVTEIARLSPSFRPLVAQDLALREPALLNGGPGGFTESMPLRGQGPVLHPATGAPAIQQALADETWLNRSGSPEAFAPLIRLSPPAGSSAKRVLFTNAFGDQTVPNPTNYTVLAAGHLFDRESLYRNDKTAQAGENPHGFLLDPTFVQGNTAGQREITEFFATGGRQTVDPDGPGPVWETPINDRSELLALNFTPSY